MKSAMRRCGGDAKHKGNRNQRTPAIESLPPWNRWRPAAAWSSLRLLPVEPARRQVRPSNRHLCAGFHDDAGVNRMKCSYVECVWQFGGGRSGEILANTSLGGCFGETARRVPSGVTSNLGLWLANGKIWIKGRVLTERYQKQSVVWRGINFPA